MKIVAIVNPVAGSRRAGRIWPRLLEARQVRTPVASWWTEGPGQAEILAAQACREGYDRVVAVGGDGTLMEVVNGLWWESEEQKPSVGTVPLGTGCDYLRNFAEGRRRVEDKLATALGEATVPISVGLARVQGLDGQPRQRIFMSFLGAGFDALVIARFQRLGLPGKAAYFLSGLLEIARLRHYKISGMVNGHPLNEEAALLVAGLGRYFGGGMMVAPGASVQSPRFQVVLGQRLSRRALLWLLPKVYTGKHLDHPQVAAFYAEQVKAAADPPAWVEGDGELLGRTPLEVTVIPEALQFAGHFEER